MVNFGWTGVRQLAATSARRADWRTLGRSDVGVGVCKRFCSGCLGAPCLYSCNVTAKVQSPSSAVDPRAKKSQHNRADSDSTDLEQVKLANQLAPIKFSRTPFERAGKGKRQDAKRQTGRVSWRATYVTGSRREQGRLRLSIYNSLPKAFLSSLPCASS